MPTVTEAIDLPGVTDPELCTVEVQLYQADKTPLKEARDSSTGETVAGRRVVVLDGATAQSPAAGAWSLSLAGNANLVPSGSVWGRRLRGPQVDSTLSYATVPTTGGPYQWQQILTDPPAALAPAALETGLALKVAKAGDTMTGDLVLSGGSDLTVSGVLKTGTFGSPATFGGIEREGVVWPAGMMTSPTAVMNFGDGFPRLNMPDGVTTDVYMIFEVQEWWLDSTIGVYFEWVNDHTSTGDVRWSCDIKECDIATQTLAAAGTIASRTFTHAGPTPAANTATTDIVGSVANGNPVTFAPGTFASFYVLRISRLGGDVADTLAGPVGLLAASMTRGQ